MKTNNVAKMGVIIGSTIGVIATGLYFYYRCKTKATQTRESFLKMNVHDFDQSPEGWRSLMDSEKYKEAALLIDAYLERHMLDLSYAAINILKFHAGQCYAYAKNYSIAIARMQYCVDAYPKLQWTSLEPFKNNKDYEDIKKMFKANIDKSWLPYVNATIAFLQHDKNQFDACKKILEENLTVQYAGDANKINLGVLQRLEQGLGNDMSYLEAQLKPLNLKPTR